MDGASHGGVEQCRRKPSVDHTDGVVVVLLRLNAEDDAAFADLLDVEAHQLRDRRRRQGAIGDRAQKRSARQRQGSPAHASGILPGDRAFAFHVALAVNEANCLQWHECDALIGTGDSRRK
jgi:hypothetical protein